MKRQREVCGVVLAVLALSGTGMGAVRLPALLSDHLVLQRGKPLAVWGEAAPGEAVTVALGEAVAKVSADAAGAWRVTLPPRGEATGLTLTVSGENTLAVTNVAVGDVWFCSGQSNMAMTLGGCNAPEDVKSADFPLIRFLRVPTVVSSKRCDAPPAGMGGWRVCSPAMAAGVTAVGFYFARGIQPQAGVPIGIIDTSWGGSRIEPYIAPEGIAAVPEAAALTAPFAEAVAAYRGALGSGLDAVAQWVDATRAALAAGQPLPAHPPLPADPAADPQQWHAKFNAMIAPFTTYPVRGFLWYQGCANGREGTSYVHKTRALVAGWRALWGDEALPFYAVQLANFTADKRNPEGGDGYAPVRLAQMEASRALPYSGLAVAIDIGETSDIHPKNKFDVGVRLARWALRNEYGKEGVVASGPLYKGMTVKDGAVRIAFDSVGGGLMAGTKKGREPVVRNPDGRLERFAIAGEDRKWYWADAVIEGDVVVVSSQQVLAPVAVRYAHSANPLGANLYNAEGLPASPFRTDSW